MAEHLSFAPSHISSSNTTHSKNERDDRLVRILFPACYTCHM